MRNLAFAPDLPSRVTCSVLKFCVFSPEGSGSPELETCPTRMWCEHTHWLESYQLHRHTGAEMQRTRIWCKLGVTPPSSSKASVAFLLQPLDGNTANLLFLLHVEMETRPVWHCRNKDISPCGEMSRGAWWKGSAQTCAMEGHTDNRLFEGNMNVSALKEMPRDRVPFSFFFWSWSWGLLSPPCVS